MSATPQFSSFGSARSLTVRVAPGSDVRTGLEPHAGGGSTRPIPPSKLNPIPIRTQLAKMLESPVFARANRARRFLSYVVGSVLEQRQYELKEYTLAIEVFDREESVDPRLETIVRVEANRLRARLSQYYAGVGQDDPIVIELPRGAYVPSFSYRMPARDVAAPANQWRQRLEGWTRALAGATLFLVVFAAALW